jgi:anti-anti-sigma factor
MSWQKLTHRALQDRDPAPAPDTPEWQIYSAGRDAGMRLELVSNDGAVTSVSAAGQITQSAFDNSDEPLALKFGEGIYAARLLLGLEGTNYLDSRGVGWLLKCHRRFRQAGGVMVIHSIPPVIQEVLSVLHLDELFYLSEDEQAARTRALETLDA